MQGVPDQPRLVAGEILPAQTVARASPPATEPSAAALPSPGFSGFGADDRRQAKAGPLLFWSTVVLAVFLVFWIAGGHRLVLDPLAETIRNSPAQALQIEDVASRIERHEGRAFLVVDGAARNNGGEPLLLPSIVISVAETDGPTLRYYLETNQVVLGPGQAHDFSSRLDAPSKGVASVSITFQEGSR
ncbi:hypothetical protein [Aliihoeflea sp. 40Bstr573]|uniref:hypothetical protein n=1 Tax=Aliihoeflea sp. 40Bstr573 TaxID=2696467 RepID=UPI002095ABEF|nr:hypothetical protein [Aliihoeflea sp. 40Bstr573]MCO6387156.1 hypothetical protein [Aliihoeflea sp. 40Bstr573]